MNNLLSFKCTTLLIVLFILCSTVLAANRDSLSNRADTTRYQIAVTDMQCRGISKSSSAIITDRIRAELFNTGVFTVLERGLMDEILKEQGFQQTGCTSDACVVEVGQLLGVTHMVAGAVGKIGKLYTISLRLIDVATGKLTHTATLDCEYAIERVLSEATPAIVREMAGKVSGKTTSFSPIIPVIDTTESKKWFRKAVQAKDSSEKLAYLTKAFSYNPKWAGPYTAKGVLYYKHGNYDAAVSNLDTAIMVDINYFNLYGIRADCYRKSGQYQEAVRDYSEYINRVPAIFAELATEAYKKRAEVYELMGDKKSAGRDYHIYLTRKGDSISSTRRKLIRKKIRASGFDPSIK